MVPSITGESLAVLAVLFGFVLAGIVLFQRRRLNWVRDQIDDLRAIHRTHIADLTRERDQARTSGEFYGRRTGELENALEERDRKIAELDAWKNVALGEFYAIVRERVQEVNALVGQGDVYQISAIHSLVRPCCLLGLSMEPVGRIPPRALTLWAKWWWESGLSEMNQNPEHREISGRISVVATKIMPRPTKN